MYSDLSSSLKQKRKRERHFGGDPVAFFFRGFRERALLSRNTSDLTIGGLRDK